MLHFASTIARIFRRRFVAGRHRARGLGQRHRTWPVGGAVADVGPLHFAGRIDDVRHRRGDGARPMAFVLRAADADQCRIGI